MSKFDRQCKESIRDPSKMVPWYLMASYLYYCRDISLLSDAAYDKLCKDMNEHWDNIQHPHKRLIDREALSAGTGFQIKENEYPLICKSAACGLVGIEEK